MKATNNNTDTLFMDIFVELFAIAKVYFQELFKNADLGTYTIKDIYAFIEKNIGTAKNIQSIVLYDEIGKIVVFFEDGEKRECLFDGESILQSVLKEM